MRHRHIEREGEREAVGGVVFLLIPRGRDDYQALMAPAEHGVEADQDQREYDDRGPARLERLQEERNRAGKIAARYKFDGEHQDSRDHQADQSVTDDRPSPSRQIAGGWI